METKIMGIGELQKHIAILTRLRESVQVVDRRRRKPVAMIYPYRQGAGIRRLAGKYRDRIRPGDQSWEQMREAALTAAWDGKYGLSD